MKLRVLTTFLLTRLSFSSASDLHGKRKDTSTSLRIDKEYVFDNILSVKKTLRRQMKTDDDKIPKYIKQLQTGKKMRHEVYGQPYWPDGEWVFYRSTAATLPAKGYAITLDVTASTLKGRRPRTDIAFNRECNLDCLIIYAFYYGKVCAVKQSTITWESTYRNFDDMCKLEYENCKNENSRPMWRVVHRGNCRNTDNQPFTRMVEMSYNTSKIIERKKRYMNRASYVPVYRPWSFANPAQPAGKEPAPTTPRGRKPPPQG